MRRTRSTGRSRREGLGEVTKGFHEGYVWWPSGPLDTGYGLTKRYLSVKKNYLRKHSISSL